MNAYVDPVVLGFVFTQGSTFVSPAEYHPGDYKPHEQPRCNYSGRDAEARRAPFVACHQARKAWYDQIMDAVRSEDAWALLTTKPDGTVTLFSIPMPGAWDATRHGGSVTLLLAREAQATS